VYSFSQQVPAPYLQDEASASPDLNRIFTTPAARRLTASISALPDPGPALDSLIASLTPDGPSDFQVSASSTWDSLPELGPDNLFDPASGKPWLAAATDTQPQLEISWHGIRTIREVVLEPADGVAASPTGVLIGSPAGGRLVNVGLGGVIRLSPPLRTDKLYLDFSAVSRSAAGNSAAGQPAQLPTGLAGVKIPGLAGLHLAAPSPTATFRLACGRGPAISVDGRRYRTSVTGTFADLLELNPVRLRLCTPGGSLTLPAGRQVLSAPASPDFTVTSLSLASKASAAAGADLSQPVSPAADSSRKLQVLSWQADNRELRIGPGPRSYVEIHENANPGWTASLNDRKLMPVTLDGWQQAYIAPAGSGGTITLTFTPDRVYHAGIIVSAIALAILAVLAAGLGWSRRARERTRAPSESRGPPGPSHLGMGLPGVPALVLRPASAPTSTPASTAGNPRVQLTTRSSPNFAAMRSPALRAPGAHRRAAAPGGAARDRSARQWLVLLPLAAVIFTVGGPIVIAVPVLALAGRWSARLLSVVAIAAMLAAGLIAATAASPVSLGDGSFSAAAQVAALVALAAALMPGQGSSLRGQPAAGERGSARQG
jgi:arabinofuranan 3-O-arabinosyltransferase